MVAEASPRSRRREIGLGDHAFFQRDDFANEVVIRVAAVVDVTEQEEGYRDDPREVARVRDTLLLTLERPRCSVPRRPRC